MSRITKATYVINMLENAVFDGKQIKSGNILEIVSGEISDKDLYLLSYKKLSDIFLHKKIKEWEFNHDLFGEPDVVYKNTFEELVYLYKL